MVDTTGIEPVTPTMSTYFSLSTPSDLSDFARQIRDVSKWCAKRFGSLNLEHYPKRALRDFSNRHAISDAFRIFASTTPCGVRRRSRSCETAARNSHRRDQAMPKHSGESLRHASWLMAEVSLAFKDVNKPVRYPPPAADDAATSVRTRSSLSRRAFSSRLRRDKSTANRTPVPACSSKLPPPIKIGMGCPSLWV